MRLRLVLIVGVTLAIAACSESTTAPRTVRPAARSAELIECRSGYHIATRDDGTESCEPDGDAMTVQPDSGQ
jgi:hypothetical protein